MFVYSSARLLKYAPNKPQLMSVLFSFFIKNAMMVNFVRSNFSAGMNNSLIIKHKSDMSNLPILIVKKGKVAGMTFRKQINNFSLCSLL